jgi:histidyl-tRNA synthetase
VGLSIGVQKLVSAASPGGSPPLKVLVCSRGGGGLLRERMQVAAELWAGNLHAQFLAAAAPSLTEQYEYAHEHGIKWLVIITEEKLSAADSVKVMQFIHRVQITSSVRSWDVWSETP